MNILISIKLDTEIYYILFFYTLKSVCILYIYRTSQFKCQSFIISSDIRDLHLNFLKLTVERIDSHVQVTLKIGTMFQ